MLRRSFFGLPLLLSCVGNRVTRYASEYNTPDSLAGLQDALDACSSGETLQLDDDTYYLSGTLEVPAGVTVVAYGATLIPTLDFVYVEGTAEAVVKMGTGSSWYGGIVDNRGHLRTAATVLPASFLAKGTSNVTWDGIEVINCGVVTTTTPPTGPIFYAASAEATDTLVGFGLSAFTGSATNIVMRNCKMSTHPTSSISFGVRFASDFVQERAQGAFVYSLTGRIENCETRGNFLWNHFEVLGGGTHDVTIQACRAYGPAISHYNLDKGVYNSYIYGCYSVDGGLPARFVGDSTKRASVFAVTGSGSTYHTHDCEVKSCVVDTWNNDDTADIYEGAFYTAYADDVEFSDCQVLNFNLGRIGYAFLADTESGNVTWQDCVARNVAGGFTANLGAASMNGISLIRNEISCTSAAMATSSGGTGWVFTDNVFVCESDILYAVNLNATVTATGNSLTATSATYGWRVGGAASVLTNNDVIADDYGFDFAANCTANGNTAEADTQQVTRFGVTITGSGNSWD